MWALVAAIVAGLGWFLFRRWRRRSWPVDPRLSAAYWRNSVFVVGAYLLSILLGAGMTRIMVGFNRGGWADMLMVVFFVTWVLYGAVWLLRFLPTTKPHPAWLTRGRGWIDGAALSLLAGLATGARML